MKYFFTLSILLISFGVSAQTEGEEVVWTEKPENPTAKKEIKGKVFGPKTTVKEAPISRSLTPLKEKTIIRENGTRETIVYEEKK